MKVLLVGAGAVGLVYGHHLQKGGAEVSFFVRGKYLDGVARGFRMDRLGIRRKGAVHFQPTAGLATPEQVAAHTWDQVWLCISATGLRGAWLAPFLATIGDATLVALQPGLDDRALLAQEVPDEQIVQGMISMVSYQAPLPGEQRQEGIAHWFPPLGPSPFTGPAERTRAVVRALRAGGCPARVHPDAPLQTARGAAILMPHLVALEAAGWKLGALRRRGRLDLAAAGSREALAVVAACTGSGPARASSFVRPGLMRPLLAVAPWVVPFPLQTYLEYHFTKVGDQTRFMIDTYIGEGEKRGLPTGNLQALGALLPAPEPVKT